MSGAPERRAVLIVDDDPDAAWLMASALESRGFSVRVAHDVADATALLRSERFDALLADLVLPDGEGYALLDLEGRPRIALALSGRGGAAEEARAQKAGFDAFLVKPTPVDVLADLLRR